MSEKIEIGVGMPQWLWLNVFGRMVNDAFGSYPYLVGSASRGKEWRDVDVRLILSDNEYESLFGNIEHAYQRTKKLNSYTMAFCELGKKITGLPIDFQIQKQSIANQVFPHQERHALILDDINELKTDSQQLLANSLKNPNQRPADN